jgi:hypothetical protein
MNAIKYFRTQELSARRWSFAKRLHREGRNEWASRFIHRAVIVQTRRFDRRWR